MTQLAQSCNAANRRLTVDATPPPAEGSLVQLEDEIVRFRFVGYSLVLHDRDPLIWVVERGVDGTTAASHASGKELVPLVPVYGSDPIENGGTAGFVLDGNDPDWSGSRTITPDDPAADLVVHVSDPTGAAAVGYLQMRGGETPSVVLYTQNDDASINASVALEADGDIFIGNTGSIRLSSDTHRLIIDLFQLPTSDPGEAGVLYTDGAASAGVPKALMISGGTAP